MSDRRLHIAVDGRELLGKATGVGRYVHEVLRQWRDAPHDFTVVVPDEPPAELRQLGAHFHWWIQPGGSGTRWEQTRLPRALARIRPDVFLAPANTAPFQLPCPMVVVVHDVSFYAHPEWFGQREGWRRRWLTRSAARRARSVVTVSEFSRQEIVRYLKLPPAKTLIASPGAPAIVSSGDDERQPIVLYVGSLFNRRRIRDLMQAFAAIPVPKARLVLVGDNRTSPRLDPHQVAVELQISDRFEWREYVSDADLHELYSAARVFAFLSDYEGFGMTPMEALACGVPPVMLDTPVTREVYGGGAVLCAPSIEAISQALTQLLTDPAARSRVITAGQDRIRAYPWARTATTLLRALEDAAK